MRIPIALLVVVSLFTMPAGADELEVLRHRMLDAKPQAIRAVRTIGDSMPLRLFDDAEFRARLVSIEDDPLNGFVWRGELEDSPGGWVVLVDDNGCLAGTVATTESYFRILCIGGGRHVIEEVQPPRPLLDDAVFRDPPADPFPLAPMPAQTDVENLDEGEIIEADVLVVFTRKAARKLFRDYDNSGFANKKRMMKAYIKLAIAIGNTALENSDIDLRLRLVKARPIGFKATGDSSHDLRVLQNPDDGIIDRVHAWRDRFGADFVSLVLDDFEPEYWGRGYNGAPAEDSDDWLFSVVLYESLPWYTLVHELGHNMGLAHDRKNAEGAGPFKAFPYSHGYQDPTGGFYTVMAYSDGCSRCQWRIPHFSNKRIQWQGTPTSIPDYQLGCGDGVTTGPKCGRRTGKNNADSARSLANTRQFYAAIRPCKVRCGN